MIRDAIRRFAGDFAEAADKTCDSIFETSTEDEWPILMGYAADVRLPSGAASERVYYVATSQGVYSGAKAKSRLFSTAAVTELARRDDVAGVRTVGDRLEIDAADGRRLMEIGFVPDAGRARGVSFQLNIGAFEMPATAAQEAANVAAALGFGRGPSLAAPPSAPTAAGAPPLIDAMHPDEALTFECLLFAAGRLIPDTDHWTGDQYDTLVESLVSGRAADGVFDRSVHSALGSAPDLAEALLRRDKTDLLELIAETSPSEAMERGILFEDDRDDYLEDSPGAVALLLRTTLVRGVLFEALHYGQRVADATRRAGGQGPDERDSERTRWTLFGRDLGLTDSEIERAYGYYSATG